MDINPVKYWICTRCHSIHKMTTTRCGCGMLLEAILLFKPKLLEFTSEAKLRDWLRMMKKYMGAKFKLGKDFRR